MVLSNESVMGEGRKGIEANQLVTRSRASKGLEKKNELGELAPVERMNNPRGLWAKQKRMWKGDTVGEDARTETGTSTSGGGGGPYTSGPGVSITIKSPNRASGGMSPSPGDSSPLELARHAALDAHGPPSRRSRRSRRSRLPSKAGSARRGQTMVKIVSKHHRVLDGANELRWTCPEQSSELRAPGCSVSLLLRLLVVGCFPDGDVPIPAAHPGRLAPSASVTPLVKQPGAATRSLHLSSIPVFFRISRPQLTALQLRDARGLLTFHDSNKSPSCLFRPVLHPLCTWERAPWRGCEHTCSMLQRSRSLCCVSTCLIAARVSRDRGLRRHPA